MKNQRVAVFEKLEADKLEEDINDYLEENPNFSIVHVSMSEQVIGDIAWKTVILVLEETK